LSELRHIEHLHACRLSVPFGHEDCNRVSLARGKREILNAFYPQLVPYRTEVLALVELHFVVDTTRAKLLIGSILQVPTGLAFLHELANKVSFTAFASLLVNGPPNLQVLRGISFFIFGWPLPRDDICTVVRESELEDILRGKLSDDVTFGGFDDSDFLGRRPGKEATVWRVHTASQVPFRDVEAGEAFIYRSTVNNTDVLRRAICKLSGLGHCARVGASNIGAVVAQEASSLERTRAAMRSFVRFWGNCGWFTGSVPAR